MTNFEKVTALPETPGEFLAALPAATGPWDGAFRKQFCDSCERKNCDEKRCPHQDKRNNPAWWLVQGGKPDEVPGLSININAAFPIVWGKEYYTAAEKKKEQRAPCTCCGNTGKVTILLKRRRDIAARYAMASNIARAAGNGCKLRAKIPCICAMATP